MTTRLAACFVFYGKISRTAFWIYATLLALETCQPALTMSGVGGEADLIVVRPDF